MASAQDRVIKGDYAGAYCISLFSDYLYLNVNGAEIPLTKETIQSYEVVDESISKSATSAVLRAGVGALLLGPVGLLAGVTAKQKGIYLILIIFKDGKQSLIEISKKSYNKFIRSMF